MLKFHAIVHMVVNELIFGVPTKFDTGSNKETKKLITDALDRPTSTQMRALRVALSTNYILQKCILNNTYESSLMRVILTCTTIVRLCVSRIWLVQF